MTVAAIDCGSGATRLLVIDGTGAEVHREERVTNLCLGMGPDDTLTADAIARTIDTLRAYRLRCDEFGVTRLRAVTTAAARRARNPADFLDAAAVVLGTRPDILTGEEEGRLAFSGAMTDLVPQVDAWGEPAFDLLLDIGGGSTEIVVGRPGEAPIASHSIETGCVRLLEEYLGESDPPGPLALSQAISVMHAHLEDVEITVPHVKRATRLVGIAGSIQVMAMVEIGATAPVHHFRLTRPAAEDVYRTLVTETRADRLHNPGLPADRVDSIVAGAVILVTVLRHFDMTDVLVSQHDLLDGVAQQLLIM